MRLPDRSENDNKTEEINQNNQAKGTFFYKPPKSMTRIVGETHILDDTPVSLSLVGQERKIRTSYGPSSVKAESGADDWYPKAYPKKNIAVS